MRTYCNTAIFFRAIALIVLSLLPVRYLPDFFTWYSLPCISLLAILFGVFAARTPFRLLPLVFSTALISLLFYCGVSAISFLIPFSLVHRGFLAIALVYFPTALFFLCTATATVTYVRNKRWQRLEPLILLLLFVVLFWSQGHYTLTLFSHPLHAALFVVFFILTLIGTRLFSETPTKHPSGLLLFLLPIFIALSFLYLGRYNAQSVASTGGLIQPTLFRFDFSPYLTLQNEISLNNKLVCIVHTPEQYSRNFLRRVYLSGWDPTRGFYEKPVPGEAAQITTVPKIPVTIPAEKRLLREEVSQEVFIVNFDPESLIAMDYPVQITPYALWQQSSFNGAYRVISHTTGFIPFELYDSPFPVPGKDLPSETFNTYTEIDPDTKTMLEPLVNEISSSFTGYYDTVLLLTEFLRNGEYRYSLKPGPAQNGNQLEHFLFTARKGYCTYFAFSLCLMLRTRGIPSRVAAGFFLDSESASLDYFPVRSNMAHAWVEVFFPEYGWISFDPTTTRIAEGEELLLMDNAGGDAFISLLNEIIDNRNFLHASVLEEDSIQQKSFFEQVSHYLPSLTRKLLGTLLVLALIVIPILRLREQLILRFSTNNRQVVLLCARRVLRRKNRIKKTLPERSKNLEYLHALEQKARFAPYCSRDDADSARSIESFFSRNGTFFRSFLILFAGLFFISPMLEAQTTARELLLQAEKAVAVENWEGALTTLSQGKSLYPEDPQFSFTLGTIYEKEKLYEPAKKEFLTALSLGMTDNPDLYEHLASCYSYLNEDEQALLWQRKYLSLVPDDLYGWTNFGWLCYKTNNLEEGITTLRGILEKQGPDGNLYVGLGNLYTASFDYENAKKYYTLAITFARENNQNFLGSIYLYNRSILEEIFYNFDEAYEDTTRSLRAASRSSGYLMQGELELRRLNFSAALSRYQKAYALDSTPLAALGLADTLVQAGYPNKAKPYIDAVTLRKDFSWIANYGTTPEQFKSDINRIQRDRYKILLSREKRRVVHSFSTATSKVINTIRYTSLCWYHDGLFRIFNKRVARFYERGGNPLYYNSFYYLAYDAWPPIARHYIRRAEEQEVSLIPLSKPSYRFETAKMNKEIDEILSVLQEFDPIWEKNYLSTAVSTLLEAQNHIKEDVRYRLSSFLYSLQSAAFLIHDLSVPVSMHFSNVSKKEERIITRAFKKAELRPTRAAPFLCSIQGEQDSFHLSIHNAQNQELYTQVFHKTGALKKDVADMINTVITRFFQAPLGL